MITPIITMTINQIAERKYDLLMSNDDIKEMARNVRAKAIDEFFQELQKYEEDDMWLRLKMSSIYEIAEQLKAGGKNE